ncbi:MAG: hypothetical protein AB1758_06720 [Candidatus Eremiobacterota bacterium]
MAWSPLERDRRKLEGLVPSQVDLVADLDESIRAAGATGGRERILALRERVEAVLGERASVGDLAEAAAELERDQRLAAAKLAGIPVLAPCAEAFLAVADRLIDLSELAAAGQMGLLLGALVNVEAAVDDLERVLEDVE